MTKLVHNVRIKLPEKPFSSVLLRNECPPQPTRGTVPSYPRHSSQWGGNWNGLHGFGWGSKRWRRFGERKCWRWTKCELEREVFHYSLYSTHASSMLLLILCTVYPCYYDMSVPQTLHCSNWRTFSLLQFDYRSVFVQPKSSTLGSCPDRFMKCFYNKVRFSCLYCWVFACGVPWVFYLALMNATIIWLYTWVFFPLSKMFDFLLKKIVRVFYSLVGDLVGPFGDCIINWLGMFCGHKCPILAKRMKKAKQIIKISEA